MNKKLSLILAVIALSSAHLSHGQKLKYPETKKGQVVDQYFGQSVPDPYRWLEDDLASDTKSWVVSQNKIGRAHV